MRIQPVLAKKFFKVPQNGSMLDFSRTKSRAEHESGLRKGVGARGQKLWGVKLRGETPEWSKSLGGSYTAAEKFTHPTSPTFFLGRRYRGAVSCSVLFNAQVFKREMMVLI